MPGEDQRRPWPRPLFRLSVAFAAGIAVERAGPTAFPEWWALGTLALLIFALSAGFLRRSPFCRIPLLSLALFFGLGALACRLATPVLPYPTGLDRFFGASRTVFLAEVSAPPEFYPDKIQLPLRIRGALQNGAMAPMDAGALLSLTKSHSAPATWLPGDMILARLTLKRLRNFNNPGGYDYVRSQAERGVYARAHLTDESGLMKVERPREGFAASAFRSIRAGLDRFRQHALFWLRANLDSDSAAFYAALLLGYQRLISPSWQEHLSRTGVTHLLSIGGMHLGLVSMATFWFVRFLVRRLRPSILQHTNDQLIALWPALLAATLYAFIAGFSVPPIWRSMLMLALCLVAANCQRSADQLTVLAASALAILVADPNSLWQISFQLTFACMFSIFILYPRFRRFHFSLSHPALQNGNPWGKLLRPFEEAFWVSIAVNVLVLPLTVYYFQGISLAGFAANVILVPAVGFAVLPPGLVSIGLYAVSPALGLPFLKIGEWCLRGCEQMILWFSNLSWAFFWVGSLSVYCLALLYAGLALVLSSLPRRVKASGLAALLVLFSGITVANRSLSAYDSENFLQADVLDVGQGSSTLVRFPGGETMLVDGGGFFDDSFDIGRAVTAPFLWHEGVRRLDCAVLSHDHPDHRNGLRFILSHFDVGEFWDTGITESKEGCGTLRRVAMERSIPVQGLQEILAERQSGSCRVRIIHPSFSYLRSEWDGKDLNNVSLVVRIDFGETHLILPGDIDQSVEREIFARESFQGEVLLVSPHHGSERSNSDFMLDATRPVAMVFSCGYDNPFGFPSPPVTAACERRRIPIYRTDINGAIHARSDGRHWEIKSME